MDELFEAPVPIVHGAAGLTGRNTIVRAPEEPEVDENGYLVAKKMGRSIPSNCRRVLNSPLPVEQGGGCSPSCPGLQRNGGCLLDVMKAAEKHGCNWTFEVDPRDGYWDYAGEPIPGYEQVKVVEKVGVYEGRWQEGHEPDEPFSVYIPETTYDCPHCGFHVVQDLSNFHYWCPGCGRNAKEA